MGFSAKIGAVAILIIAGCYSLLVCAQEKSLPLLKGKYIDEQLPGNEAKIFASGIVSTEGYEHSAPIFSPDGKILIWGVVERDKPSYLLEMDKVNGAWTKPSVVSFSAKTSDDMYPYFSADGKKLHFCSRRPLPSGKPVNDIMIWAVPHDSSGWGQPSPLDSTISPGYEYAHSISQKGDLVFSTRQVIDGRPKWSIWYSKFANGKNQRPEKLPEAINDGSYVDGPYLASDGSYLIFESDRPGGLGSNDLYICARQKDGSWGTPKSMTAKVNSPFSERFAGLSPDGKYFFFSSNHGGALPDIYWIEAGFIKALVKN